MQHKIFKSYRFILFLGLTVCLQIALSIEAYAVVVMEPDGVQQDTVTLLEEVAVVAHLKQKNDLRLEPLSSSVLKMGEIEGRRVATLNDFSAYTPNLYIPDYGSKMTSSIYVRGLGSRIDNPAVGLYIDQIPYLNKNGFDTDLWDIMRMEVLRGPQSTLYGRNTIGGIININTLSPMLYQGTRISATYGSGNSYAIKGSTYWKPTERFAFSVGGNYNSSDGFFKNVYDNSNCDWIRSGSGRVRLVFKPNSRLTIDNTFIAARVEQGGYAYSLYNAGAAAGLEGGVLEPVNYNDESGYLRTLISNGLSMNYSTGKYLFSSVTSWQYLDDCMTLDQDFTPKSMFTLQQAQREHTVTQDFVVRTTRNGRWQWLGGITLFYKHMKMDAPVRFKRDGIETLILHNINNGIHQVFPEADIIFRENEFDISSRFTAPVFGSALYHQSEYNIGRFTLTAGLRIDYEHNSLRYNSNTALHYRFTLTMPEYKKLETVMRGEQKRDYIEPLPKFAVQYSLKNSGNIYLSLARGFKAGGYNTQMFSDILQNRMKGDMMEDLGVYMDDPSLDAYTVGDIITYKPEYSWNYEIGGHFNLGSSQSVVLDAALFYIACTDQQLTVFPSGTTTGRMMTNAGKTRSLGAELALNARITDALKASLSYGYTNAKFTKYDNGITDYKGKYVPYSPQNTLSATADYSIYGLAGILDRLTFRVGYNGIGKIYWNEANSMCQNFYSLLNASIFAQKGVFSLELWGKNLTDENYYAFYFVSVGNTFLSRGKPAQYGVTLSVEL